MSRLFSKDDAEKIFAMAVERQHSTEEEPASGLTLEELEEAGQAAGIDPTFIRAAAADLLRPGRASLQHSFLGFPVEMRQSRVFPAKLDEATWQEITRLLGDIFRKKGISTDAGMAREWISTPLENQLPIRVIAEPEMQGTRITVERKMWPQAVGFSVGVGVNLLVGLIFLIVSLVSSEGVLWIPGAILVGIGLIFGLIARVVSQALNRRQAERFDEALRGIERILQRSSGQPIDAAETPVESRLPSTTEAARIQLEDGDKSGDRAAPARRSSTSTS